MSRISGLPAGHIKVVEVLGYEVVESVIEAKISTSLFADGRLPGYYAIDIFCDEKTMKKTDKDDLFLHQAGIAFTMREISTRAYIHPALTTEYKVVKALIKAMKKNK
jgi:hypothetical protein